MKRLNVERLKREAKKISKESGVTHSEALDWIAQREGFKNWSLLMNRSKK